MPLATLVNSVNTDSAPNYMVCEYSSDGIGADTTSSELIIIELPSRNNNSPTYRSEPNVTIGGEAYIIELKGFNISCNSTNFDVSIFNVNNLLASDTINEIARYTSIDRAESDQSFDEFVIRNRDASLQNRLYLFINNHDSIPTGTIRVELVYIAVQDRLF